MGNTHFGTGALSSGISLIPLSTVRFNLSPDLGGIMSERGGVGDSQLPEARLMRAEAHDSLLR
jgi:hypothetical protein